MGLAGWSLCCDAVSEGGFLGLGLEHRGNSRQKTVGVIFRASFRAFSAWCPVLCSPGQGAAKLSESNVSTTPSLYDTRFFDWWVVPSIRDCTIHKAHGYRDTVATAEPPFGSLLATQFAASRTMENVEPSSLCLVTFVLEPCFAVHRSKLGLDVLSLRVRTHETTRLQSMFARPRTAIHHSILPLVHLASAAPE